MTKKDDNGKEIMVYYDTSETCTLTLPVSSISIPLLNSGFLRAMNENMNGGNQKESREPNDWKELGMSGFYGRLFAIERHLKAYRKTRELRHLAAIGCNAMICFWLQKNKGM